MSNGFGAHFVYPTSKQQASSGPLSTGTNGGRSSCKKKDADDERDGAGGREGGQEVRAVAVVGCGGEGYEEEIENGAGEEDGEVEEVDEELVQEVDA